MVDLITVAVPALPSASAVTGDELVPAHQNGRLVKIAQRNLRGTRLLTGPSTPPTDASTLVALALALNDRWRNTLTGDEWKVTGLTPTAWTADGNVYGSGAIQRYVTAAAVGSRRVVKLGPTGLAHASSDDLDSLGCVIGLSASAADAGAQVAVQIAGLVIEPSWTWTSGPVFLGLDGLMTQVEPDTGFVQRLGISDAPTHLWFQRDTPILL